MKFKTWKKVPSLFKKNINIDSYNSILKSFKLCILWIYKILEVLLLVYNTVNDLKYLYSDHNIINFFMSCMLTEKGVTSYYSHEHCICNVTLYVTLCFYYLDLICSLLSNEVFQNCMFQRMFPFWSSNSLSQKCCLLF